MSSNGLALPFTGSTATAGDAFGVLNTGSGSAIQGDSTQGDAVVGTAHAQGQSGVLGISNGATGAGVTGTSPISHGVHGVNGNGANNPPTIAAGVWGETDGGYGVYGASIDSDAIHGDSTQSDAVVGIAHAQGKSGVLGTSNGSTGAGVTGTSSISHGVHGVNGSGANNPPTIAAGVWGETDGGYGVYGASIDSDAIHGDSTQSDAVVGIAHAQGKSGVLGISDSGNGVTGISTNGNAGNFLGNVNVSGTISVGGDVILTGGGQDCAEEFIVSPAIVVDPGTVMVINSNGELEPSRAPYDKRAAGVISGAGDLRPAIILGKPQSYGNNAFIALIGKVNCKVDARNAAVEVGDLLTTSPTLGHAMKVDDPVKGFGAVIGKALQSLSAGEKGVIPILVALQ